VNLLEALRSELFPFQLAWINDVSRYRVSLKPRQCGMSDVWALEKVLGCAGLRPSAFDDGRKPAASSIYVTRDLESAKEQIARCWKWYHFLREDPYLRQMIRPTKSVKEDSRTRFALKANNGLEFAVRAQAPTEKAGRGAASDVCLDEAAWYGENEEKIWTSASKSIVSNKHLRLSAVSTPNGAHGNYWALCTDRAKYAHWSLHQFTLKDAIAAGFPLTEEEARRMCFTEEEFEQEFMCSFLAAVGQYLQSALIDSCFSPMPPASELRLVAMGADVASTVDLTAVIGLYEHIGTGRLYSGDVYAISGVRYQSAPGFIGQDRILDALIRRFQPPVLIMDATGDGAKLFGYLQALNPPTHIVPHEFSQKWKLHWVPRFRGEMERATLYFGSSVARMYQGAAGALVDRSRTMTQREAFEFIESAFGVEARHNMLRGDLHRVHRKMTLHGMTYDTTRDKSGKRGHGDSFWALCMALAAVRSGVGRNAPQRRVYEVEETPDYFDLM
jgi:phage FluMu gp28-like protein